MRQARLTTRLAYIWLELWLPIASWAAITIPSNSRTITFTTTAAAIFLLARSAHRGDLTKNVGDTIATLINHNWPPDRGQLLKVTVTRPYPPHRAATQRIRTGHWGAPAHTITLTVRGTLKRDEYTEWARTTYEFATADTNPSPRSVGAWDITLTNNDLPYLVAAT